MRIAIAVIFALYTLLITSLVQDVYSHGVPSGGVARFLRVDNEQFSASNLTVGGTIEVTVELRSLVNRDITISQALIAVSETSAANAKEFSRNYTSARSDQWRIVNATYSDSFVLAAGETMSFSMNITALESGNYHLHSAFAWSYVSANGTQIDTTYYGRGATIQVMPTQAQLQECQELGIASEECNQRKILQMTPSQKPLSEEERERIEDQQGQINNSIYMIGIGAAIASVVAFVSLRRLGR